MKKSYQQRQPLLKQRAKSKQPCLDAEFEDHSLKQTNKSTNPSTKRDKWELFGFVY